MARRSRWRRFPSRRPLTGGRLQRVPRPPVLPSPPLLYRRGPAAPCRRSGVATARPGRRGTGVGRERGAARGPPVQPPSVARRWEPSAGPRARGRTAPEGRGAPPCPRPQRAEYAPLFCCPAVPAGGVRLRVIDLASASMCAGRRGTVLWPKAPWLWCSRKFCCETSARAWWYAEGCSLGFLLSVALCFNSFAVQLS